jgi:hypothetical protein
MGRDGVEAMGDAHRWYVEAFQAYRLKFSIHADPEGVKLASTGQRPVRVRRNGTSGSPGIFHKFTPCTSTSKFIALSIK